jgi:hypothetical protein
MIYELKRFKKLAPKSVARAPLPILAFHFGVGAIKLRKKLSPAKNAQQIKN